MVVNGSNLSQKIPNIFFCNFCNYKCSNKKDYNKHLTTRKHQNGSKMVVKIPKNPQKSPKIPKDITMNKYVCECGKTYKWESGLYRHKKVCTSSCETIQVIDKTDMTQKLVELITSKNQDFMNELVSNITSTNKDVMEKMLEIMPNIGNNSHNITNSHNTQNFNIHMFLNEHCKNAMNLTDFIDTLPITAETYDHTIENGLTKTITNMITNGLSQLDILERPIHCTDASRKTIYVKEEDIWEKDTELVKVLLGITKLARKQRTMINKWKDVNEGWEKDDSIQTKLTHLICHSMTDIEHDDKEIGKIVRTISKKVYLDNESKQQYIH